MTLSALANRALLIKLAAAAITYGFTILLARTMLAQDFGKIAFFLNLSLVLSVVGARGQQMATLRFVPPMIANHDLAGIRQFLSLALPRAAVGTAMVFSAVLCSAIIAKSAGMFAQILPIEIWLGLALIPLVGWVDLQSHLARACNLLSLSLVPKEILWRGAAGLIIVGLWMSQSRSSITATQALLVLALVLVLIGAVQARILAQKSGISTAKPVLPAKSGDEWNNASGPFWLTSVSNIFLTNADVILVGLFAGTTAAGLYFAANRLAMLLAFFLTSYNVVLAPMLANAWQAGGGVQTREIIHHATLKMTVPTALFGVFLFVFAPQFLSLFGPDFLSAALPLRILVLAVVVRAALGPADLALNMCGFHRDAMRASAFSLALSAVLLGIGAAFGGATGVALAVLLATTIRKAAFWWLAWQRLGIRCDVLAGRFAAVRQPVRQTP